MQDVLGECLRKSKKIKIKNTRMLSILLILSLVVSLDVFWILRQPGLTLAGDADCRITEHTHDDICQNAQTPCELAEHVHTIACYSDHDADAETQLDWQRMFADYPYTDNLQEDLVGIAKTQVGYSESVLNFEVDDSGGRHGYTRYGAWYGVPYNDWSAAFVSFCLHYSGADPNEFPGNIGASSMLEMWRNLEKYASAGTYEPSLGDLVFFADNTVGIVAEVQNATICVIRGDVDDAVCTHILTITDETIVGWGLTKEFEQGEGEPPDTTTPQEEPTPTPPIISDDELLDISEGPAFFIFEGGKSQPQLQAQGYSLRKSRSIVDLLPYLEANGGSYFFTLLDLNNVELPKDENGAYIAQPNTLYKLTITFNSPEGFRPGTYQHQIANGLMVDGGDGSFILQDGTNVGTWEVTDTGLITMSFNEHVANHADITISTTMGIRFPEQDDPIDFDGKITVSVEKPPPQSNPTIVNKWGNQGGVEGSAGTDPNKIYWGIEIIGNKDSQIPGSILTDRIIDGEWSKTHRYTESDIAGGLSFGAAGDGNWHNWKISADDPHLIWTETGWSYKMPKTVTCEWCGEIELGNEGWYYYIDYTSTPNPAGMAGTFGYENDATIDGAYGYAWVNFTHGEATGEIIKNGYFVSDAGGGAFLWEFQATIPGRSEGQRAQYHWYIMDSMKLLDSGGQPVGLIENDAHLSIVTLTYNGTTIQVPRIQDATDDDFFAWDNGWSATENGINHGREFNLLCRCQCTKDTCHWQDGCGEYWFLQDDGTHATNGFCQCWTITENVTVTFVYETKDLSIVETYGGFGYQIQNVAELFYIPEGASGGASVSRSEAVVSIPGVFKKELTHDFDGYTANYNITINEAKLVLTDGSPLHIHDEMTNTLAYISGSLVITAEDANGNRTELQQGTDYTVNYDGTGNQTDAQGKEVHVLDIVILHPQPVTYILDYDTTLIIPEHVTEGVKYSNSASITLWGAKIADSVVEKIHADINIASKSYKIEVFKTAALTGEALPGAMFGLYNEQGGLITTAVTDSNGRLIFQTNIVEGIILRDHVLYYMQELRAPVGYQIDNTKYWFCFCDKTGDFCGTCNEIVAAIGAYRIPFEQSGKINIANQLMNYDLPGTGGPGIYPLILVSVIFIITPLIYISIRKRKRERRETG